MRLKAANPTMGAFKNTAPKDYVNQFKAARAEAQAIDGTPADSDSRDGFVQLPNDSQVPGAYVQIWGPEKQSARVTLNSSTYKAEDGNGQGQKIHTQKDRYIEMQSAVGGNAIEVSDRFTQSVDQTFPSEIGEIESSVWDSHDDRFMLVNLDDASVITTNAEEMALYEMVGGHISDYNRMKADLQN